MIDTGLKGKTIIVTGANHGIGAATAIAFAQEGAKVLISYLRQSPERIGKPEDIAKAVIFFSSDQAEWITGQVLQVGSGNRM